MTGFYTVQVLPEAFPNDFRKIWNVRVFTHHPEEVKTRTVRLSLSDSTTIESLEGFPTLLKYVMLSGETSESGSPFVSGFRMPGSQSEGVELRVSLMRFLHKTSGQWWDGYEGIFQDVPTPHYRSLHVSALSDEYGPRKSQRLLYVVYSPQD